MRGVAAAGQNASQRNEKDDSGIRTVAGQAYGDQKGYDGRAHPLRQGDTVDCVS